MAHGMENKVKDNHPPILRGSRVEGLKQTKLRDCIYSTRIYNVHLQKNVLQQREMSNKGLRRTGDSRMRPLESVSL